MKPKPIPEPRSNKTAIGVSVTALVIAIFCGVTLAQSNRRTAKQLEEFRHQINSVDSELGYLDSSKERDVSKIQKVANATQKDHDSIKSEHDKWKRSTQKTDSSQWQDIQTLKSQRLNQEKLIAELQQEIRNLERENVSLEREIYDLKQTVNSDHQRKITDLDRKIERIRGSR